MGAMDGCWVLGSVRLDQTQASIFRGRFENFAGVPRAGRLAVVAIRDLGSRARGRIVSISERPTQYPRNGVLGALCWPLDGKIVIVVKSGGTVRAKIYAVRPIADIL